MRNSNPKQHSDRNGSLVDVWSFVHVGASALIAFLVGPLLAIVVTFAWEPLENFVISPLLGKFGILFGHETLKNSLSDLVFNAIGITMAYIFMAFA